ncbi:hypothetical protein [Spiroplasma endosymbiont of Aspidapion aeneum]|uniref:hypothetical protein n=1 Tax=Spiroplasma endosymbiont of Aspidapion aeneum TaxID=3066276 RepID=UPI00313DF4A9
MNDIKTKFISSNKMLSINFQINKRMIIFFSTFWFVCMLFTILILWVAISPELYIWKNVIQVFRGNGGSTDVNGGVCTSLSWIILSAPSIIYYSIVSLYFINKTLIKEISNDEISFWITLSFSRKKIITQKLLFNFICFLITYLPVFLMVLIYGSICKDANKYIGLLIVDGFNFALFMTFLIIIYFILGLLFSEKGVILNIIVSLMLFYIFLTFIINLLPWDSGSNYEWAKYFRYISIQSLFVPTLNPSSIDPSIVDIDKTRIGRFVSPYKNRFNNWELLAMCISDFFQVVIIILCIKMTVNIFDKMDL